LTPIATVAPTTIDNHTNCSPNKETDHAKQSISTTAMSNVTLRALFSEEIRAGLAASICRTSTTNKELPKAPTGPTATDIITNTSKNFQASTTTTTAAAPIPTVHDSTVP